MVDRTITYLMSGAGYYHYLICSLYTLRSYWEGKVQLYAYPESFDIARQVGEDSRLGVEVLLWEPHQQYVSKNSQFCNKILVCQQRNTESRLYLDSDTTIHGDLTKLFLMAEKHGFAATRFNRWNSNSRVIQNRLQPLKDFPEFREITPIIDEVMNHPYPSPNGGVLSCRPDSCVLSRWFYLSWAAKSTFIADEAVLHLLQLLFSEEHFSTELSGRYNCSFKWKTQVRDPIVMHYHGNSCTRPEKSKEAADFWWPIYEHCLSQNIGNVQNWRKDARNKYMMRLKGDSRYAHLIKE